MGRTNYAGCYGDTSDWVDTGLYRWEGDRWVTDTIQAQRVQASCRGVFVPRKRTSFRDITDGLSNTVACGEIVTDLGDRDVRTAPHLSAGWYPGVHSNPRTCQPNRDTRRPLFWAQSFTDIGDAGEKRGFRWASGRPLYSGFNTVLPPNEEVCLGVNAGSGGHASVSSRHQGGAHVLMSDGAVNFITDSIDAGDDSSPVVTLGGSGANRPGAPSPYGLWGALGTRAAREVISEKR
jgi:prepilin-type processing-associated H-X9-DG protein